MLKSVKQFFALSLCLLMLLPFASAAFVDPVSVTADLPLTPCTCTDPIYDTGEVFEVPQPVDAYYCKGSYIRQVAYQCLICYDYKAGAVLSIHRVEHIYPNNVRCSTCGWLITDT
ncbi:MAG: hypothetical protein IJW77_08670 [Clostridia bacterium]|nr:hypothetical protein [Clostridia bacterium]